MHCRIHFFLLACPLLIGILAGPVAAQNADNPSNELTKSLSDAFTNAYKNIGKTGPVTPGQPAPQQPPTNRVVKPVDFPQPIPSDTVGPESSQFQIQTAEIGFTKQPVEFEIGIQPLDSKSSQSQTENQSTQPLHQDDAKVLKTATDYSKPIWWQDRVTKPLGERTPEQIHPEMLIHLALKNSPRILAISEQPVVQETQIEESRAEFDPDLYLRSQFDDRVDPVGNTLTTGGLPFLEDHIWYSESGVRKKLVSGGEVDLKQRLGYQNSNSRFFEPQDQGTATLSLNFNQPLMRGRGKYYNRSQILIAQIGTGAAWDKFAGELQNELTQIVESYWTLYYSRAILLQKEQNVQRGQVILEKLEGRSELDSLPSQIARARAAVQSRSTELANARRDVKDAETDIRRLIGSPQAFQSNANEIIPVEIPTAIQVNEDLQGIITLAMQERPEVKQALKRAKIAAVQRNVSDHELMPELNLIFNSYVSALEGDSDIPTAWAHQFTNSTPGYALGLEFNVPYGRRAARARLTRQQVVLNQIRHEIDQVIHEVVAESQVAWRRVESAFQTMFAANEAILAARSDLEQNEARWNSFGLVEGDIADGQTPTTLLDQLLDAQQRLTNAELTYSQALLDFKVAEIQLKQASGTLLDYQQIRFTKATTVDGPQIDTDSDGFVPRDQ